MDKNLVIQYTAVGIVIIGALVWLLVKFIKRRKCRENGMCHGCALSDKCKDRFLN